ncbi:MAG: PA14 domain-containing protein [Verrucomicrobiota bacterium]
MYSSKTKTKLAVLFAMVTACSAQAQINIPTNLMVRAPLTTKGGNLRGEYWKRPPVSVPLDGSTNPTNRIDNLIAGFGQPSGTFKATKFVYLGNDLTHVTNWLGADATSFAGQTNNLDDGVFRLSGFLNVTNAGTVSLGTTSDDGSRITIGGVDIVNNDGSHGDATVDTNVVFAAAGVYPIEVTYFNGDWTDDGTGDKLNHSGNPDPAHHGGANFHLRVAGADVNTNNAAMFYSDAGSVIVPSTYAVGAPLAKPAGSLNGEYWKRPVYSIPLDGATNPTNRIDELILGFGSPQGTFKATKLVYLGNDLTGITNWLDIDAKSFVGTTNNLDDGAFHFTGFINVTNAGATVKLGTTSDDGSRISIGGIDIVNNDGSHGDATVDTNVFFTAAGLYPIEVTYFNGDWTDDGTGDRLNHSGNPDPAHHGGANFHLRINGADVTTNTVQVLSPTGPGILVPPYLAAAPPLATTPASTNGGSSLYGEYWRRPVYSIPLDGATNPTNRIDALLDGFGPPTGTFQANSLVYLGNDLTSITNWLSADAKSYSGSVDNLDDGAFRFTGWLNVTTPKTVKLGTTSDDGSRITIAGLDIVNNDGSHGDATVDANVVFAAAGLYPIEVTYFNGDWTDDGTGDKLNHSGNPDPAHHGGANFHLRVNGADVTTNNVSLFYGPQPAAPAAAPPSLDGLLAYWNFDGTLYDSVNDFHGTARGKDPVEFVDSQAGFGKALKLDGTNWVEITGGPVNGLDSPNGSLSIAGWFKVEAFDKSWQALIAKGENSNYRVARRSDGVITNDSSIAYAGGVGEGAADTPPVNDGKWHHFVAVTDSKVTEFGTALYIDGVRHSVNTNKPALTASAKNLLIGENPDALNRQWTGQIDDISIWNRVLTSKEVTALYNGGQGLALSTVPGVKAPTVVTVLDFPFNEGKGTNTVDAVHDLVGTLGIGIGIDSNNVPVVTTRSPAGTAGDRAVTLNKPTRPLKPLVVNDRIGKTLAFATNALHHRDLDQHCHQRHAHLRRLAAHGSSETGSQQSATPNSPSTGLSASTAAFIRPMAGIMSLQSGSPARASGFFLDSTSVTNIAGKRVPRAIEITT